MPSVLVGRHQHVCSPEGSRQGHFRTKKRTLPKRERNKISMLQRSGTKPFPHLQVPRRQVSQLPAGHRAPPACRGEVLSDEELLKDTL